jgi:hypothetical protein
MNCQEHEIEALTICTSRVQIYRVFHLPGQQRGHCLGLRPGLGWYPHFQRDVVHSPRPEVCGVV